jgi:hypothetical protein
MSSLVEKLHRLSPTPGPWDWLGRDNRPQGKLIHVPDDAKGFTYTTVADADTFMDFEPQPFISCENADDAKLIALAPAMRAELLKTADALELVKLATAKNMPKTTETDWFKGYAAALEMIAALLGEDATE